MKERYRKGMSDVERAKKRHGVLYYAILVILFIFALSVAWLPFAELGSLLYELELLVIQWLRMPVTLPMWNFLLYSAFLLVVGYFSLPILTIPSTGEWYFIVKKEVKGPIAIFHASNGTVIRVYRGNTHHFFLHWFIFGQVSPNWDPETGEVFYETEEHEVTEIIGLQRMIDMLANKLAIHREMNVTSDEEFIEKYNRIEQARHGRQGGEEE